MTSVPRGRGGPESAGLPPGGTPTATGAFPRGRPRLRRGRPDRREQTRAALLQAAQRLWAERGVHGASLEEIATAAGLTKGAVYSNFTGKTDLLLALLERYTHTAHDPEPHEALLREGDRPLAERLRQAGECYRRRLSTDEARLLALLMMEFWLFGMRDYAAGWRLADWYGERRHRLARQLPDTGGVPADDRAALVMAMDFGLAAQHLLDPDRVPAELYATGLSLILGPALRQPPP